MLSVKVEAKGTVEVGINSTDWSWSWKWSWKWSWRLEAGSGAGGWIWRLEQELEWQPELDLEAGVGAEAEGTKSSEIPSWGPKIRILGPNSGFISNMLVFQKDFDEKWPLSKPENVAFAPGDRLYNSRISLQVYHQKCILREP